MAKIQVCEVDVMPKVQIMQSRKVAQIQVCKLNLM